MSTPPPGRRSEPIVDEGLEGATPASVDPTAGSGRSVASEPGEQSDRRVSTMPGTGRAMSSPADHDDTVALQRPVDPAPRTSPITVGNSAGADESRPAEPDFVEAPTSAPTGAATADAATSADVRRPRRRTVTWHTHATGPVPVLPGEHPKNRWRKIAGRTLSKTWGDSIFGWSSQAAFWCALSTAPLLLALLGMTGFVAPWFGPDTIGAVEDQVMSLLHTVFDDKVVNDLLASNVHNLLTKGQADVVSVGFVISLWAGSSAISAFVEAITIAYGQHEVRHPAAERFFALGLYLCALVFLIFLLPLAAIGPNLMVQLFPQDFRDTASTIIDIAYFPVLGLALVLLVTTLYKVAPKHKHPWKRGIPGALLAAVVFLVTSHGLRIYVAYVTTHGLAYGSLATPIVFLLFYYFVSMAIIIGAQFNNATLEFYPPRRTDRQMRKWRRLEDKKPATGRTGAGSAGTTTKVVLPSGESA